ncbi:M20 aminoacylase family protein [Psychromarinibacter halotolerans]|uniref:M20 aminoacylase family protein n=1 Tax=Psychromarinibacter halotolerans TaxID=1775175 RepID=A0ABV7GV37_9RHOB|nr:M20 aminoacylase family protein [Psychromarinibacter halotolerans]MDF0595135.1 M20 family metallopeptidase [Psychromarinibacter halotolerans]
MAIVNRIGDFAEEMKEWRRWLHRHPELEFACHGTAAFVAEKLKAFGVDEIHEGIATSGVVAIIKGQGNTGDGGPVIGLRADMDALPMSEETGLDYASEVPGAMHACGHDGHTTMLLGAAKYLAETRNFRGRVALIFQPAEEQGGGGGAMVDEGVMDRFGIGQVFALHCAPHYPLNTFHTTPGPLMAAVDDFVVTVTGRGGHAAMPQEAVDPIPAVAAMVQAAQTIVTRNTDPMKSLVISITQIHAGSAHNVIPEVATFAGTIRSFDPEVRQGTVARFRDQLAGIAGGYGVTADLKLIEGYPPTINTADETAFAAGVAAEVVGEAAVDTDAAAEMGAEDFSFMLEARPGSYLFLGQGEGPLVHHPKFDFNDEIAPVGASFFARLVERAQPVE